MREKQTNNKANKTREKKREIYIKTQKRHIKNTIYCF